MKKRSEIKVSEKLCEVRKKFYAFGFNPVKNLPTISGFSSYEIAQTIFDLRHERYDDCLESLLNFLTLLNPENYNQIENRLSLIMKLEKGAQVLRLFDAKGFKSYESFKNIIMMHRPELKECLLYAFWNGEYLFDHVISACLEVYHVLELNLSMLNIIKLNPSNEKINLS